MSKELGMLGEQAASDFLEQEGWEILARNFTTRGGEIDIIAEKLTGGPGRPRRTIAIVEVKTRRPRKNLHPEMSVTFTKRKTIVRVAKVYLRRQKIRHAHVRFDVIAVDWRPMAAPRITHIRGAFDELGRVT